MGYMMPERISEREVDEAMDGPEPTRDPGEASDEAYGRRVEEQMRERDHIGDFEGEF